MVAHRKSKSIGARLRRLVRDLLGLQRANKRSPRAKAVEGPVFTHLWRSAVSASFHPDRFAIDQPNVLLFQMGKVASTALTKALFSRGINCFHCHSLRYEDEAGRLSQLFKAQPDLPLAARELKLLAKHTTLNMLVRWYRLNQVPFDRKLKVVTLTRDPVDWFISHFVQRFGRDASPLVEWHRHATGAGLVRDGAGTAAAEMFRQVGDIVVEARPSADVASARRKAMARVTTLNPPQPQLGRTIESALGPISWFERQFTPLLDIDLRSLPEFRESGLAQRDLGSVEILVVRFEDFARHRGAICRHVGLETLKVGQRNVTSEKPHAGPILQAGREFLATELGLAFQRELRATEYGRACGYDRAIEHSQSTSIY
jgi:hypothetical protein